LILFENSHGVLLTIGGTTLSKCRPNFEKPAPTHTVTISSFAATIMSTNGKKAKKIISGRYCSLRAARKTTLSRRPRSTSRAMIGMIEAVATSSVPGRASAAIRLARSATYRTTSSQVRESPPVNGTLAGQGATRTVPGRPQ
jgi:hypothetical protein